MHASKYAHTHAHTHVSTIASLGTIGYTLSKILCQARKSVWYLCVHQYSRASDVWEE